jgi:L-alanine-DL-glutamate epimerase-like enolase superfamily enzyme
MAHSGTPDFGVNAIFQAARLIPRLAAYHRCLAARAHPLVGAPSLTVTRAAAGIAANIVPDTCELLLDRRLAPLRERFGQRVLLSVDANGCWEADTARAAIAAIAPVGLRYVEQPLPPGDWDEMSALAVRSTVPITLDESLSSMASVERLIACRTPILAHLKLAKLGGLDRLMAAARRLTAAGIGVMVGQMNEGVVSTLGAAHAALALRAPYAELYGADGLERDPAGTLTYAGGTLALPQGAGLGLSASVATENVLWEQTR